MDEKDFKFSFFIVGRFVFPDFFFTFLFFIHSDLFEITKKTLV